jgi:hypothetical protein
MNVEEFREKLRLLISGEITEDEVLSILTELEEDKLKSLALKSKKIADFFNRNDNETEEAEDTEEAEETEETEEAEEEKKGIDDLLKDDEEVEETEETEKLGIDELLEKEEKDEK